MTVDTILQKDRTISIGVLSDTHIPDRAKALHPGLLKALVEEKVDYLFHAGDISHVGVLNELEGVAPVFAVRGNRDILLRDSLPKSRTFQINGVLTHLTHGHLNPLVYWSDKIEHVMRGYRFERYLRRMLRVQPPARVYIFGHSHHAENTWIDGRLFFNAGSVSIPDLVEKNLSFGLLRFGNDGSVKGEILPLVGSKLRWRKWGSESRTS